MARELPRFQYEGDGADLGDQTVPRGEPQVAAVARRAVLADLLGEGREIGPGAQLFDRLPSGGFRIGHDQTEVDLFGAGFAQPGLGEFVEQGLFGGDRRRFRLDQRGREHLIGRGPHAPAHRRVVVQSTPLCLDHQRLPLHQLLEDDGKQHFERQPALPLGRVAYDVADIAQGDRPPVDLGHHGLGGFFGNAVDVVDRCNGVEQRFGQIVVRRGRRDRAWGELRRRQGGPERRGGQYQAACGGSQFKAPRWPRRRSCRRGFRTARLPDTRLGTGRAGICRR